MENVTISRRKHTSRKENKENAEPRHEIKSIKRDVPKTTSTGLLQLKRNEKEETLGKSGPFKASAKPAYTRSASGDVLKKVRPVQRDVKGAPIAIAAAAGDAKQRQTHSQAFLSQQAVRHKIIAAEAPKPPAPAPTSKPALGTYKGRVVQSKIGSIWKSNAQAGAADPKQPAPKPESQRVKRRSNSVAELQGHGAQRPAPSRSKSASDGLKQTSKPAATSRPPAAFRSTRPPIRTAPATLTSTSSRNTTAALTKGSGAQSARPKVPVTDKKVNKPPVTSTHSQYRFSMETAEERRAKLADWLASKGKSLKRPATKAGAAASKTKASAPVKPEADLKPQSHVEPQAVTQRDPEPEPEPMPETQKPDSPAVALCADIQVAELPTHSQTPVIMNTTLDLLENSDADLPVDPQDRIEDIVVNLCDALEAMGTPSQCADDLPQATDDCSVVEIEDSKLKDVCEKAEMSEIPEGVGEQPKDEQVSNGAAEEDYEQKAETEEVEEVESDDDDDDEDVMETTPEMEDASVVKYSVKTTPYLQSVKKTIEDEVGASGSRRKSNIKDWKFLTPVRRSSRIQRKSSRLPSMLVDHDTCVSSLAELVKMDDNPNAYIYRKNPALLDDLPDQTRL